MARPFIVAIDGPAGAGKSTVSRLVARRRGFALVETGAIYRSVALAAQRAGVAFDDRARLLPLVDALEVSFQWEGERNRVYLHGFDVTDAIKPPESGAAASQLASHPWLRTHLLDLQRQLGLASQRGTVLEGRDIGTVVFPDADLKVFLDANPEVRAQRRADELNANGAGVSLEEVLAEQRIRDKRDREREVAPLIAASDATLLDTSRLSIAEVVTAIDDLIGERGVRDS